MTTEIVQSTMIYTLIQLSYPKVFRRTFVPTENPIIYEKQKRQYKKTYLCSQKDPTHETKDAINVRQRLRTEMST